MNTELELFYFNDLKKEVISHFREDFGYVPENPSAWKIMHINYFQEHLFNKIKGNFSDRWFYTYFKNEPEKIPRIDMLNILSEYAGYKNWDDFINQHEVTYKPEKEAILDTESSESMAPSIKKKKRSNTIVSVILIFSLILLIAVSGFWYDRKKHTYYFYFKDNDRNSMMKGINVYIPSNVVEPKLVSNDHGRVEIYSRKDSIRMMIQSTFYKSDTLLINLKLSDGVETIDLMPNDYALMVYYYSNSQNTEVDKRRKELHHLIADNALIYQVYDNENYGQEVLTKEQYINMMTAPTETLKNFVLISSEENKGKITRIKFKILPNESY